MTARGKRKAREWLVHVDNRGVLVTGCDLQEHPSCWWCGTSFGKAILVREVLPAKKKGK